MLLKIEIKTVKVLKKYMTIKHLYIFVNSTGKIKIRIRYVPNILL